MDISPFFHGVCSVAEENDRWTPVRMTQRQLAFYAARGKEMEDRACCQSGVRMAFTTDAAEISFDFQVLRACRDHFAFDVYEDGVLCASYPQLFEKDACRRFSYTRTSRAPRSCIEIYFPTLAQVSICNLHLGNAQPQPAKRLRYLAYGDSITQGIESDYSSVFYPALVARFLDAELLSLGVGSEIFCPELIDPALAFQPDLITVAYGINDSIQDLTLEQIEYNADRFLSQLVAQHPQAAISVISPIWIDRLDPREPGYEGEAYLSRFFGIRSIIKRLCDRLGLCFVDGMQLCPHCPQFYADKTVHPDAAGFAIYALELLKRLRLPKPV